MHGKKITNVTDKQKRCKWEGDPLHFVTDPTLYRYIGCHKKGVPCLRGCRSINGLSFTQLHWSGFNLEFETLHGSICEVVADLWQNILTMGRGNAK